MGLPLTRKQLDEMVHHGCPGPDCDYDNHDRTLFLHGQCHPGAGTRASYFDGIVTIACRECERLIVKLVVADG